MSHLWRAEKKTMNITMNIEAISTIRKLFELVLNTLEAPLNQSEKTLIKMAATKATPMGKPADR